MDIKRKEKEPRFLKRVGEDCSSASGSNHTDLVTGNGKFWFPVALQCSFLFRNPLCDLLRFDEIFFNCFYHQY